MSDTSNLASNNIEPSMEDILSSIRKVIAEDLSQKQDGEIQVEPEAESQIEINPSDNIEISATEQIELVDLQAADQQSAVQDPLDDILDLDNLLGDIDDTDSDTDELMELIQLDDDTEGTPEVDEELETLTVPSPSTPDAEPIAESLTEDVPNFDFDETLDLVMDTEASDYVTENIAPIPSEPQEERIEPTEILATEEELTESILDDILLDEQNDADFDVLEITQEPEPVREAIQPHSNPVSTNDDMDLVKSLLDDLMDEPISETVSASVETVMAETSFNIEDVFSEEDLLIPEPETVKEEATSIEELIQPSPPSAGEMATILEAEADTAFDNFENTAPAETESENAVENELAQLAREIAEVRDIAADNTASTDDVVELSTPDFASKLAISASLTGGAALVDDETDGIIAAAAESDLESLQQLIAETDFEETTPEATDPPKEIDTLISPIQEDETMAAPLKNDALSDADTQLEAGNAFASLTSAVQEHELAEENGPPIGELVKEALRPMLQEWLDKNLKGMVQRAVTKEIKRISSGK